MAATGGYEPELRALLLEPPAQQHQPAFEVVAQTGQAEPGVESELAVGEFGATALDVGAQELPQNAAGQVADQVLVFDEDAVVAREEAEAPNRSAAGRGSGDRGSRARRRGRCRARGGAGGFV